MTTKTDNAAHVGMHVFERAGLGKAPFRFVGSFEKVFQATPDSPRQPGGTCDFCGTGIMICCAIRGADGREFKVGSDCLRKTGDAGLIKAFKTSPAERAKAAAARQRNRDKVTSEWNAFWADPVTAQAFADVEFEDWRWGERWGEKEFFTVSAADHFKRIWAMCGAAGEKRWLKHVKVLREQRLAGDEVQ